MFHSIIHEPQAQVIPCTRDIPWLGFVVYPTHRRVKARNFVKFPRCFHARWDEYCAGNITFAEFDASVKGWINRVRYADTLGLRKAVFRKGLVFRKPAPIAAFAAILLTTAFTSGESIPSRYAPMICSRCSR